MTSLNDGSDKIFDAIKILEDAGINSGEKFERLKQAHDLQTINNKRSER